MRTHSVADERFQFRRPACKLQYSIEKNLESSPPGLDPVRDRLASQPFLRDTPKPVLP